MKWEYVIFPWMLVISVFHLGTGPEITGSLTLTGIYLLDRFAK